MKDLTFILVSRCDNYSCSNKSNYNEQLKKVLLPIRSSETSFPQSKFILVEYCPGNNPRYKDLLPNLGIKIITLKQELQDDLQRDGQLNSMNFYEHLGKHIGIINSDTEYVSYINQDIILPKKNASTVCSELLRGNIVVGYKDKISYEHMNKDEVEIIKYCNDNPQSHEHGTWGNGDFIAMSKQQYMNSNMNTFWQYHQNWGLDNLILKRAGLVDMDPVQSCAIPIVRPYIYYSLDHPQDGLNRPNVCDCSKPFGENAKPIFSSEIIQKVNSNYYVEEIVQL